MDLNWQRFIDKWQAAKKTQRAVYAGGCAAAFAFLSSLLGVSGWLTVVACGLVALGGALIPIGGQSLNEHVSVALAAVLILSGSGVTIAQSLADDGGGKTAPKLGGQPTPTGSVPAETTKKPLQVSVEDDWQYLLDGSFAYEDVISAPAKRSGFPDGGVKVGAGKLRLTLYNPNSETASITDIRAAGITSAPPISGALAYSSAEGTANDLVALDLKEESPVLREISRNGKVGDPYFAYSHIDIDPRKRQVLEITVLPGPHFYTWHLELDLQVGEDKRMQEVKQPEALFKITGYATSDYQQVFNVIDSWSKGDPATFCESVYTHCHNLGEGYGDDN